MVRVQAAMVVAVEMIRSAEGVRERERGRRAVSLIYTYRIALFPLAMPAHANTAVSEGTHGHRIIIKPRAR